MGKAARWFRGLLGLRKDDSPPQSAAKPPKRRWSFVKLNRDRGRAIAEETADDRRGESLAENMPPATPGRAEGRDDGVRVVDPSQHAIAVAAATAAVAEAAVAAAQAAAEVVRLTSSGRSSANAAAPAEYVSDAICAIREEWAAVLIQAHFRGYLARRALRALKGLVKLQALVRGYMVRKHTADVMRYMQVLLRAQARARVGRSQISESQYSSNKASQFHNPGPATPEKFEQAIRSECTKHDHSPMHKKNGLKSTGQHKTCTVWNWMDHQMDEALWNQTGCSTKSGRTDDGKSTDKILEVDTGKPNLAAKRRNLFHSSHPALASDQCSHSFSTSKDSATHQTGRSTSSCELHSLSPLNFTQEVEESPYCTAKNSPRFHTASSTGGISKSGPFTPTRSDGSRSYLSGFSDCPSYMACTESSRAKARSLSAPKQRPQYERSLSAKRYSVDVYGESRSSAQRISNVHSSFANKAYPGSGHLDRLGMPATGTGSRLTQVFSYT